jgi:hypothetical protein
MGSREMKKTAVFSFGRYQPISVGHGKLFDAMAILSRKLDADMHIYASHTQDDKKNPLNYKDKVKFLKLSFPKYKNNVTSSDAKTIFDVIKDLAAMGHTDLVFVVGQDRKKQFNDAIKPYINTDHKDAIKLNSFNIISAGNRDPDSDDDIEAISASKLRDFAKDDDYNSFVKGISQELSTMNKKALYDLVRNGLKINNLEAKTMKEDVKPGFDPAGNPSRMWQSFRKWFYIDEEDKENRPDSDFLVVDKKTGERNLPVKANGKVDPKLMGAAHAALTKNFRGQQYKGPDKAGALNRLKALYKKEKMDLPE